MLFCTLNIFAQQYTRDVVYKKPTIDEFNYWKNVYEFNTQKTGKVNAHFIEDIMKADTSVSTCLMEDSIKMQMKVLDIIKLDNFYTLDNEKIRKIDVYYIWLAPLFNGEIKKIKFHFME